MQVGLRRTTNIILVSLVALDLTLASWGFFAPDLWYLVFHGASYVDPQALLPRCAAHWTAFFLIQLLALVRWQKGELWWLLLVAGSRFADCLTDITCAVFCDSLTLFGLIAFPVAGITNVVVGAVLVRLHHLHMTSQTTAIT